MTTLRTPDIGGGDLNQVTDLSVVLPIYNEESCLRQSIDEIVSVLMNLELSWEIIGVDDGSRDKSSEILKNMNAVDSRIKVIGF